MPLTAFDDAIHLWQNVARRVTVRVEDTPEGWDEDAYDLDVSADGTININGDPDLSLALTPAEPPAWGFSTPIIVINRPYRAATAVVAPRTHPDPGACGPVYAITLDHNPHLTRIADTITDLYLALAHAADRATCTQDPALADEAYSTQRHHQLAAALAPILSPATTPAPTEHPTAPTPVSPLTGPPHTIAHLTRTGHTTPLTPPTPRHPPKAFITPTHAAITLSNPAPPRAPRPTDFAGLRGNINNT